MFNLSSANASNLVTSKILSLVNRGQMVLHGASLTEINDRTTERAGQISLVCAV